MLSKKQQEAYDLRMQGKTFKQIGQILGISQATARDRFRRAEYEFKRRDESELYELIGELSNRAMPIIHWLMRNKIKTFDEFFDQQYLPEEIVEIRKIIAEKIDREIVNHWDIKRKENKTIDEFIGRSIDEHYALDVLRRRVKVYSNYYKKKCEEARQGNSELIGIYEEASEIFRDLVEL